MRILLVAMLASSYAVAMDQTPFTLSKENSLAHITRSGENQIVTPVVERWINQPLERVKSATNETVDVCVAFLKRFQSTPSFMRKEVEEQPREQSPLHIELAEPLSRSQSTSPLVLGDAIVGDLIPDSPPKSPLQEDAALGKLIPEMPTLFRITNKTALTVHIVAVLTAPYKPKKYVFGPGDSMIMMSPNPDGVEFEEVFVPQQEGNTHLARYAFKDFMFVRLVILKHAKIKDQLRIIKK